VRRPVGIDVHAARLSDVGKERDLDEDSILTLELGQVHRSLSTPLGVYAIADGMGGHDSGDVASRLAVQTIARCVVSDLLSAALDDNPPAVDYEAWLKKVVQDANQAVLARRKAAGNNMGTTLVMAVVVNNTAYLAHVGDSRAYLIRNAQIQLLTVDHSLVERLIATRQITREEAAAHPQRNVIYKNIGDKAQVEPDISQQMLEPGDRLLLCCDGLSGEVSDADLLRIVLENPALPEACWQLVRAANEAGGRDNISVVLSKLLPPASPCGGLDTRGRSWGSPQSTRLFA
jgi:serine/threonine protein phosphatase PrpC